ncbi:hypothetical protein LshimejAT787_1500040 [Lyophyllum shimeji]|uniref:Uncharacterized protein n=1 Tax=Lyophyllum shimeji TaxID=47721 RepID=A0A9P3PXH1_LYOSH|nr:hypothetical protein LshimejAT787_1500040 [Lyophyllum shimeji]
MQPGSDVASQIPATDPEQEAWQRLMTVEGRLEYQAAQVTQILESLSELRRFIEQHVVDSVPHDPRPTAVQPTVDAQTPAHTAPVPTQPALRSGDRLRPAPPDSFDGEREKGRTFINSCDLYMSLAPDAFPDEQTRINWALSYMKGGRAARFAARALRHPNSHGGVPRFRSYVEFRAQFIAEFCPQDEKQKAATTLREDEGDRVEHKGWRRRIGEDTRGDGGWKEGAKVQISQGGPPIHTILPSGDWRVRKRLFRRPESYPCRKRAAY